MSWATGRGAVPRLRRGERAAEVPGRCVGPSRSGRGVRRPRGKRWVAGTCRGREVRRRARSLVWWTRYVSAERLQGCQQPRRRRQAAATAGAAGANEAWRIAGTTGSIEVARDPRVVWVNGSVGEPQVVGPIGSVWVTGTGGEEQPVYRSPRGYERKGRPGSMGHESILELWLKVQAMRAASGCGEGSRVELHTVPAGEGLVERGVPGRASWVETSHGGLTGPWVEGQVRAVPQALGISTITGLGAGCERCSGSCGLGQAVRVPGTVETSSEVAPHLLGGLQAMGMPGTVEAIDYDVGPGPWGKGLTMGWLETLELPGGMSGLWERGQSVQPGAVVQGVVCGDTPGLWGREQALGVPRAVEEETASVGAPGLWQRRCALEEMGPRGVPDLQGTRQPVGVPCVIEKETRCGGDPGFRERGQAVWVETGSAGDTGSWEAAQTGEVSGPEEQEAGARGALGRWSVGQAMGVPRALGKEISCGRVPGLWGTDQPVAVSQAEVVPGAIGEQARYIGVPGFVGEETCCENVPSLWERRQAVGKQEALVPTALVVPRSVDQETGYRSVLCLCRRRQARDLSETVGMSQASGMPKHRCAPAEAPSATGVSGSGRVPLAVCVSGLVYPEMSSRDVLNLSERIHTTRIPMASEVPELSEGLVSVRENAGSSAFPGLWGRRQVFAVPLTDRVTVAPEEPGLVGEETGSGGVPRCWARRQSARVPVAAAVPTTPKVPFPLGVETGPGRVSLLPGRRQTAGVPVTAGVATAGGVPVTPRAPRPVLEELGSESVSGLWEERETVRRPTDAKGPTRMAMPTTVRMSGPIGEKMGSGSTSGLSGGRQTAGLSMAVGLCPGPTVPGPAGEETLSGGLLGLAGRRQTAEMPVAARVPVAVGLPIAAGVSRPMVGDTSSGDVSSVWGRRPATERPATARAPGPVDSGTGSEGISGLWRRRPSGTVPEAVRVPLSLGVLAAVGVPRVASAPAAGRVTGSTGEANAAVSGRTVGRSLSVERPGVSGEEIEGGSILGLAGRSQAPGVSYTHGHGTRLWGCLGSVGEETDYENVPGVSGTRTIVEENEAMEVSAVSREERGIGCFRDHPQQGRGRQTGGVCGIRVRGDDLGENCVREDRLREAFQ
ncbi:collagen alpha-2(I) chain [Saccopteryx bilineata]|uniref:collagen alpha-2(I) chain n=1 Tax=Saccopteryx bilineata TaxID=59482 RepID=UPI00338E518D